MPEPKQTNRKLFCRDRHDITCTEDMLYPSTSSKGTSTSCHGMISNACKYCSRPVPMERFVKFSTPNGHRCQHNEHNPASGEKCSIHDHKTIEYYCTEHSVVGCTACMTIDHRNCSVDFIPNIASEIGGYECYRKLDKGLRDLGSNYSEMKKQSAKNVEKVENDFRRSLHGIRRLRKNVNTYFDKLESETVKVLLALKDDALKKMATVSKTCLKVTAEINALASELEYKRQFEQQDQFFIAMKKSEVMLKTMQDDLEKMESQDQTKRFRFEPSADVCKSLKTVKSLGDIVSMKDPEDSEVSASGDVSVCLGTEARYCHVTGVVKLKDGPLVVADFNNKCVKLLNPEENKVSGHITTSSEPWDVTSTSDGRIAVTLPNEQKIVFLSLAAEAKPKPLMTHSQNSLLHTKCEENTGSLSSGLSSGSNSGPSNVLKVESEMSVNGSCKGITSYGDRLIVTFCNPPKVEILESNGKVLRRFGVERIGEDRLVSPEYVCLSPDQTIVYVSDKTALKLFCFGIDGKLLRVYSDRGLSELGGVVADRNGTVFVCNSSGSEVQMLTPEGAKIKTILDIRHGLVNPSCITYAGEDKLYVGSSNKGVVRVFTIK